ncbi:hypothetical protein LR48_Vigan08g148600 [Vigna angularis]|uniref:Uncharacterized protein n=1 Tax=Phaseolus angularis TaxID=3914 RepID=A0A0L9V7K2_PHAAN|nr:hypothetical protein LR48_Vigan08g148600 [Vigna angularis]
MANEMKNVGFVVLLMIMLCFSEAKLSCRSKCEVDCLIAGLAYPICVAVCIGKCPKMSKEASECITRCGVKKSINIKIDLKHKKRKPQNAAIIKIILFTTQPCESREDAAELRPSSPQSRQRTKSLRHCKYAVVDAQDCLIAGLAYPICVDECIAKCPKMSKEASECITRCGVKKSINIKIGPDPPSMTFYELPQILEFSKRLLHLQVQISFSHHMLHSLTWVTSFFLQSLPSNSSINHNFHFPSPINLEQKTDPSVLALQIELFVNLSLSYIRQELKSLCSRAKVVALVVDVFANGALDLPDGIFMNTFLGLESEAITTLHEHMKGKPEIYPVGPIIQMGSIDHENRVDLSEVANRSSPGASLRRGIDFGSKTRWWWLPVAAGQRRGRLLFTSEKTHWQMRWKLRSSRRTG